MLLGNQSGLSPGWTWRLLPPVAVSNGQTLKFQLSSLGDILASASPSATLSLTSQADKPDRRLGVTKPWMGSQPRDGHLPCPCKPRTAPSLPFLEVSVVPSPPCSPWKEGGRESPQATRPLTTAVWVSPLVFS